MTQQIPTDIYEQIVAALKRGDMPAAMEIYRNYANCDTAEAQRVVGTIMQVALGMMDVARGNSANSNLNVSTSTSTFSMTVNGVQITGDAGAKVRAALQSGNKEDAVRILHDAYNIDSKAAKNAVDLMEKMQTMQMGAGGGGANQQQNFQTQAARMQTLAKLVEPEPASEPWHRRRTMSKWTFLLLVAFAACAAWWFLSHQ